MKSIRVKELGGPEVMEVEEVESPNPGPRQVTIRVRAIGVNPVDTYIRGGRFGIRPDLPLTPGFDCAGEIGETGEDVDEFSPGDRVYSSKSITGTYAEEALCSVEHVFPLPDEIDFPQGAALGIPYGTAVRGLYFVGEAEPFETLLVHGATGSVGSAVVELGVASGMTVFGTGGTKKGRQLVENLGAREVFDHHSEDYKEEILDATDGRGVDVVLDMLATENLNRDLSLLAYGGRVVVIGAHGEVTIDPRRSFATDGRVLGMTIRNAQGRELEEIHRRIRVGLRRGDLSPVIRESYPLEQAPEAHETVMESGAYGKIILVP